LEELDATTFVLEVINFLVLVWILQRFLFKPVRATIARRQEAINASIEQAHRLETDAESLRRRYENRVADWEQEKARVRAEFKQEMIAARERALADIATELEGEREKSEAIEAKRRADSLRHYQQLCIAQGGQFVARLLRDLASEDLEARLFRLALDRLDTLPAATIDGIRMACESSPEEAAIATAFPLPAASRDQIKLRLDRVLGLPVRCHFREEPDLLAGLNVTLGPWVFRANLRDELAAFVESAHESA
jgi:F-type H+-transporting ATPase subunit b